MNFEELSQNLDPDVYQRLKTAIELGKWPNGEVLSPHQKEITMQAIIAYEVKNLPPEERTGYIHAADKTACGHDDGDEDAQAPVRWT
ncbi:YeaC family protein [Gilvimarinus sp. F26214L]|uniref:YeaC family protein n=1 Tax=Gilvimarinus sp. DZF01 TaxID=3461371 RepID=UPI00404633CE